MQIRITECKRDFRIFCFSVIYISFLSNVRVQKSGGTTYTCTRYKTRASLYILSYLLSPLFALFCRGSATEIRSLPLEATAPTFCIRSTMQRITRDAVHGSSSFPPFDFVRFYAFTLPGKKPANSFRRANFPLSPLFPHICDLYALHRRIKRDSN